ncbi:hypothetical protein H0H93_008686 [Arthromyces matolae]|nr:hypothetical protein H0H93_008686 [Arthromyces matolae]
MMKPFHGLLPTLSTISILALALVVQATPLPTKNNVQVTSREVLADPSTSEFNNISMCDPISTNNPSGMRDGEHSIRSYSPFDSSGTFARMDSESPSSHIKKEEPDLGHNGGLSQIPTHLTMSDLIKQEKEEEHEEERALSSIPTPREALPKLKEEAEAALRNKQALPFWKLLWEIHSYHLTTPDSGPSVENTNMPQDVRNLAEGIWKALVYKWKNKDFVYHSGSVRCHPEPCLSYANGKSLPYDYYMIYSSKLTLVLSGPLETHWKPKDFPLELPEELRIYLRPNRPGEIEIQQLLDLGQFIFNIATTHHSTVDQTTYDDMIIVGYQLMLVSAMLILEKHSERVEVKALLYMIRDAQYAQRVDLVWPHSEHVKECLTAFNNYLTREAYQHRMRIPKDSPNWRRSRGENLRAH